ncbi:glycoside hydrolase family 2 protein [Baekduia sp. Peel2402]|uniref:glycoside hydrolase family 2 protein n=1 Tax=Baekduia sp. Peel2402 TaxID=3458296 RepID=UPI00403E732F
MPRWPEQEGLEVERLAFDATGLVARFDGAGWDALVLDGVGGAFEVVVNGELAAAGTSMFVAHTVDLRACALHAEGNVVEIRPVAFPDVPRKPRQRWRTKVVEDAGTLRWRRQSIIGRAPGFAPGPPLSGPFRPAWLVRGEPMRTAVRTQVDASGFGVVSVDPAPSAVLLDGERFEVAEGEARIPDVERWWPHTHGSPRLHDLVLLYGETRVGVGRVGFRSLSPGPEFDADRDALALAVNGAAVFARGAVWTPCASDAETIATLELLRDAGANMVRIPGIGMPESSVFWDACDELGLLVWQDFSFANMDYPIEDPDFRAAIEAEARALLEDIAGRPSLTVLCGNSEVEQQAAMFGVDPALGRGELFGELLPTWAFEAGCDVPYVPSAPCGGAMPFHPGTGVANYFGVGGYRRPLSDARTAGVTFASECLAIANVGDEDANGFVPRDVGADWDFADVREHYRALLYGDGAASPALARQVSGDVMAQVFGEWRRAASPCGGGLVLWARDLEPGAGWGLIDAAGRPKVALAHLRRAWAPRAVWLVDEGLGGVDVHVANDAPEPWVATLDVALMAGGAHAIAETSVMIHVAPHSCAHFNVEGLLGRFADAAYAYRFGPPAHDAVVARIGDAVAVHFPVGPPVAREAFVLEARADGDGVVLRADRLAWGVRVHADGFVPDDDAFVLLPGVERRVGGRGAVGPGARVTALNLIGETPVSGPDVAA